MSEEIYSETQLVEYQARQLQQVLESIDAQVVEISGIIESLKDLESVKSGAEVLFPIVNGIFVKGVMSDDKMLRINVGNNVVVEKTVTDAIMMMTQQLVDIKDYKQQVSMQMELLVSKLETMNYKD